ncbi:LOW QUALITY PROTEIN: EF-hand calcium-binding domain-containing protein 12-like [Lytechinus variegatus]|uniref:LOW QUALITY PROTEIN: EF-hand calcium-binding domain-containing protein 12-like n=1 Tax=Lytechinus variegatus TaxID=7654 RepID=UPI001BB1C72F|nr:LOW QUALITY PROTEIN: EF-hand calcium-binding domain-containing protein 12-like [Lytechinus variegatus]
MGDEEESRGEHPITAEMEKKSKKHGKQKRKKKEKHSKGNVNFMEDCLDFGLLRLFNPDSTEFLPMEEQLKLYKHRDLSLTKTYITAARVFGNPRVRKRVHVAPKMDGGQGGKSVNTRRAKSEMVQDGRPRLKPINKDDMVLTERDKQIIHDNEVQERMAEYKSWLHDRMALRAGLESMGLKESWLRAKPDPTPLERRVLLQLEEARRVAEALKLKVDDVKEVIIKTEDFSEKEPKPQPEGMGIIASYLASKKQRLIDLFSQADKDKSWAITRDELRNCIKEAKIPISETLLNEVIDSLDSDFNAEIDYREFVRGMERYQLEERKRKIIAEEERKSQTKIKSTPECRTGIVPISDLAPVRESVSSPVMPTHREEDKREVNTPDSMASLLEIPKRDITERRALNPDDMIEKRKREKFMSDNLKKKRLPRVIQSPLKTGNKAVDLHSQVSTLGGDLGVEIHDYRAARLAEYHAILRLCEERGIPLTPKLLQRALLHPGDKRVNQLKKRIRQPGTHTMSNRFAEPPKPPESPDEFHDMEKVVVTKSGEVLVDSKHVYPKKQDIWPKPEMQNLSSGKAFISRKIDCWMSFEEYERLTGHLKQRYVSLENAPEHDVFWPGFLLDKIQLCMPETRPRNERTSHALFQPTRVRTKRSNPGYNNDISYWVVSDENYLKTGGIDERKVYSIDWK